MTDAFKDLLEIQPDPDVPEGWVGIKNADGEIIFFDLGQTVVKPEWAFADESVDQDLQQLISKAVNDKMRRERSFVEERILNGHDKVVVQSGDKRYVYYLPSWHTQFSARLKVELERQRRRRMKKKGK